MQPVKNPKSHGFVFFLAGIFFCLSIFMHGSQAEKIAVSLTQEQDGGEAGRACIYVHNGKAEFRVVKPGEPCAAEIIVDDNKK